MLAPFGKQFQKSVPGGVWVAMGPDAWGFAKRNGRPIMVLPDDAEPADYDWPSDGRAALIHETGEPNDDRLQELATELMKAGAPSVVAIRHALKDIKDADPRIYFDAEVIYDAA